MARFVDLVFVVLVFLSIFYTFLPHSIHSIYSVDWILGINLSHDFHVFIGIVCLILSIYFYKNFIVL